MCTLYYIYLVFIFVQFMHSTYTYAYIHTYIYIHTRYINKFSRSVPFKAYISGCMNSYFNAHTTYIHTFLTTYRIHTSGHLVLEPLLLPPLESPSPSLHGACSYIPTYITSRRLREGSPKYLWTTA